MSRFSSQKAYNFTLKKVGPDHFRMSWTIDFHYANSRLRHPRLFSRDTDLAGAKRFAKKHEIRVPE